MSPDGSTLTIAAPKATPGKLSAQPGLRLVDVATGTITRTLLTNDRVTPINWTADGLLLAGLAATPSANYADDNGVINPFAPSEPPRRRLLVWGGDSVAGLAMVGTADAGSFPLTMMSSPWGRLACVSDIAGSTVTVVDLADPACPVVVTELPIPKKLAPRAHGLAYLPAPA